MPARRGDNDYNLPDQPEEELDPWGNPLPPKVSGPTAGVKPPDQAPKLPQLTVPHDTPYLPGGSDFQEGPSSNATLTPTGPSSGSGFEGPPFTSKPTTTPGNTAGGGMSDFLQKLLMSDPTRASAEQRAALMKRLTGLMDDYSKPVNANDPLIKGRTDAYQGNMDRSLNKFREFAAERGHAEGVPTGAFDSQVGGAIQAGGQAVSDFQGQLMSDELNHRRSNLSNAIAQDSSNLTAQDSTDLQQRLATIDSILRQQGLTLQGELGRGNLDLGRLIAGQQNNQFYDRFAYDQAKDAKGTDADLIRLLLG